MRKVESFRTCPSQSKTGNFFAHGRQKRVERRYHGNDASDGPEPRAHGIRVNAIGPRTIVTELNEKALLTDEANRRLILSRTPIGRFGTGAEVAGVAIFLASDDASYLTGETIYVDGGRAGLNYTVPVKAGA
jgi:hypothetical protein